MKVLFPSLFVALFMLFCGFTSPDPNNVKVTDSEINAHRALLDSLNTTPDHYLTHDFLYPKFRQSGKLPLANLNEEYIKARPAYPSDSIIQKLPSETREKLMANQMPKQTLVNRLMTPERKEFIKQLRQLASNSILGLDNQIVLNITKEDANALGISELAYNNYNEWMIDWNHSIKMAHPDLKFPVDGKYGFCEIYFDDNLFDPAEDIIIFNPKE